MSYFSHAISSSYLLSKCYAKERKRKYVGDPKKGYKIAGYSDLFKFNTEDKQVVLFANRSFDLICVAAPPKSEIPVAINNVLVFYNIDRSNNRRLVCIEIEAFSHEEKIVVFQEIKVSNIAELKKRYEKAIQDRPFSLRDF